MNILFLTTHINAGGITSYLEILARGLIREGHRVFLASSGGERESVFTGAGASHLKLNIRTKSELDPRIYWSLPALRRFIEKHDIDVLHAQTRITQVMAAVLTRWLRKPYVTTCHGFFKRRFARRFFPCWGRQVIAISQPVQEHLKRDFRVAPERTTLILHGIELGAFPLAAEETRRQARRTLGIGEGPVIGNIARLSDVKGPDLLVAALPAVLERFPMAKLLLVGQGRMQDHLKDMVDRLGLSPHVMFVPRTGCAAEVLPVFDVFVMPSRQEGLGLSVMEAMAAGIPVVASNVGGLSDLIEHGKTGLLVQPESVEGLAQAVIQLLSDREKAHRLAKQARAFVAERHGAARMVNETMDVYRRVVSQE